MNVLDLFSGIGGFSLGLERAGMRTVAFCEIDPYARAVLRKHWPDVPCYPDIRTLTAAQLAADGIAVDVICGGFPCQDISVAGKGAGLAGERSGLWSEYRRLISELRPRYVVVENVSALLGRGLGEVLGDLAEIGYDAEWHCIPAAYVGAPHRRDRIWIVAYPGSVQYQGGSSAVGRSGASQFSEAMAYSVSNRLQGQRNGGGIEQAPRHDAGCPAAGSRHAGIPDTCDDSAARQREHGWKVHVGAEAIRLDGSGGCDWWTTEPDVGRVADGVPSRLDRLRCLGNAVVPQIPEIIGRAIMKASQ